MTAYSNSFVGKMWRRNYDSRAISGMIGVVLWRPILMEGPLQHMPLGVCDPNTVRNVDVFPTETIGFAPNGRSH